MDNSHFRGTKVRDADYELLGVTPSATPEEINESYKRLARPRHKLADDGFPLAMQKLQKSYERVLAEAKARQLRPVGATAGRAGSRSSVREPETSPWDDSETIRAEAPNPPPQRATPPRRAEPPRREPPPPARDSDPARPGPDAGHAGARRRVARGNPITAFITFWVCGMFAVVVASAIAHGPAPSDSGELTYAWFVLGGGCSTLLYLYRRQRSVVIFSLVVTAVLLISTIASTRSPPSAVRSAGPGAVASSVWSTVGGAEVDYDGPAEVTVSYPGTFWGGIYAPVSESVGCNYRFDATASLGTATSVPGQTPGYGIGVRSAIAADGVPSSQAVQYDPGAQGYKDTLYPEGSENGAVIPAPFDNGWHHISVTVSGNRYKDRVDGRVVFSGTTPLTCGGLFVRVWRATVELRDMKVTAL